ncbi:C40 family peptidase [Modicisalibacter xianhensis]|uniref:Cell wall-associated hydrolase, NlpC family n=1 Tax=Modicisalibacter xianhensis TaxID=442341 RepID=A0A1I3EZ20_9GAMM|nr:C40 family peptidase [Halomonas xianhensis]SFI04315.1 Cell wall-associated hydrolase, NlpC family [Halomonas xianhensis]
MLNAPRAYTLLFTLFLLSLLAGCASGPRMQETIAPTPSAAQALSIERAMILANARQALGTPYRYGGASIDGVDCSGLVQMTYGAAGIAVPRTANQQFSRLPGREQARPGDLLFFGSGSTATHVGIYLGQHQMIHAPGEGREVTLTSLDLDYWQNRFLGASGPAP